MDHLSFTLILVLVAAVPGRACVAVRAENLCEGRSYAVEAGTSCMQLNYSGFCNVFCISQNGYECGRWGPPDIITDRRGNGFVCLNASDFAELTGVVLQCYSTSTYSLHDSLFQVKFEGVCVCVCVCVCFRYSMKIC